ncbi:FitA-like ribbon-helix-helix domain-containing protein [Simplicispira psychrophila]|uniref:FitA-like ribbon-helix-helix domain-containing protein n=1 Tax=Simplicispira psychrophila TaxID=80882 RepID=UPI000487E266|nr:plasmid stabilization protein [Simplicispira psychrophila]
MATLTIRNFDDDLKATLRMQAARHGQSMEEEVRSILRQALTQAPVTTGLGTRLADRFAAVKADFAVPPRSLPRAPLDWAGQDEASESA